MIGDELKHPEGGNVYLVEEVVGRHVKLKCIWFSEPEDLGDRIMCTKENQCIWVAMYHYYRFVVIEKECK